MRRLGLLLLAGASCSKVPIYDVGAGFSVADVSWFAEEQTLFVFAEVHAEQGLGDPSVLEVTWRTDDGLMPWTPLSELPRVHTHLPVDCGTRSLCGSTSVAVPLMPRDVGVRLRYHRDGELALQADTVFNVVGPGPPHTSRSLVVYGVFDETNTIVQWRARHQFPTIRNQRAEELGLRRAFVVHDQGYGTAGLAGGDNPYGYGVSCPSSFVQTGFGPLETLDRARFNVEALPLGASAEATVCAAASVTDATGTFTTGAVARKNPEVEPAFPLLRSPVRDATPLKFFLGPCDRVISEDHEDMQRQRLLMGGTPTTCTDEWEQPDFVDELVALFRDAVEAARPAGDDLVLVIALHQDEPGLSGAVEQALAQVVPDERERSSPRLAGAFVLDSTIRGLSDPDLSPVTLWCPSTISLDEIPDASARSCATLPDIPDLQLGPFTFGALPILPSRDQYLDFIETYSKRQAGTVEELTFRVPEFAATADHVDLGPFGVATFLNNERIDADRDDAFSFCVSEDFLPVVYASPILKLLAANPEGCEYLGLPEDECEAGLMPLDLLPEWHETFGERTYDLGVVWEFPFLLRLNYETVAAGAVSALGFSVPFGFAEPAEGFYGAELWTVEELPLDELLTQCKRFCGHPTFDSAGVYHPTDRFRATYLNTCYLPAYPQLGDDGFPLIRRVTLLVAALWAAPASGQDEAEEAEEAEEDEGLTPYRTPFDVLADRAIGTTSTPVEFNWRKSPVMFAAAGSFLMELNNFNSARVGAVARVPTGNLLLEFGVSYVNVWDTPSSRLLALTPFRQPGRPDRMELDVTVGLPLAEGVVTVAPRWFPAAQLVFNAYGGLRYIVHPTGFPGMKVREVAGALFSPLLTEIELENLDDERLDSMQVDSGRYGLMLGFGNDIYFKPGLFVSPRVMFAVPLLAPASQTDLLFWTDVSLAAGFAL